MTQKASIGRVVHFVAGDGTHTAATVSYVYTPYSGKVAREPEDEQRWQGLCDVQAVDLHALWPDNDQPVKYVQGVPFNEAGGPLSWHWPERE